MAKAQKSQASRRRDHEVEVLPPEAPELSMIKTDGAAITSFLANVVGFFRDAAALETRAKNYLVSAKALTPPTTAEEDADLQAFIKTGAAGEKEVEAHWGICQVVSGIHRKLTAARGRGTAAFSDGRAIAQRYHNDYADRVRREAAREQERIRQLAEDNARAEQEREAKALEAEAVRLEEASADLSDRERIFVDHVFMGTAGERAAGLAGFKEPFKAAARLMSLPKIQAAIKAKQDARTAREQAAATREKPLDVRTDTVRPDLIKVGTDRSTWTGELLDADALMEAFLGGKHGIPRDLWQVNPTKLNEYARALHERLDLWPGVRAKKNTTTI